MTTANGRIEVENIHKTCTITDISFTYPLKLMQAKSYVPYHCAVYSLSYGGGLLENDSINMDIHLKSSSSLSILTQASTKVYKRQSATSFASQSLKATVDDEAFLAILPEPVTCFASSAYRQTQSFRLKSSSSLILLDWLTSGRTSNGEIWDFDFYHSENHIYIDEELVLRDAWYLTDERHLTIKDRLKEYHCVANLFLIGRECDPVVSLCKMKHDQTKIHRSKNTGERSFIWSLSPVMKNGNEVGIAVRSAAVDTFTMRSFLNEILKPMRDRIGDYFSRI